ncbi:MAG TPA: enoyl-CoA hydratase-related protein [Stellaceae bacterium]|nr:enoyl-CoA hydratase-related protein [Stellaceae bacterium]
MSDAVKLSVEAGVATLTLNRPQAMNALNAEMVAGINDALERVEHDPEVRVLVITGGGNGFMAGGDIKYFTALTTLSPLERRIQFERFVQTVHPMILRLRRMPQPVIAQVHGACAGFGMSLMMACDLAIAADDAIFTLAYIHLGVSPDGGSTYFLPRQVGAKRAMEIALLGDRFDAAKASQWGLINEAVPFTELQPRVAALARRLAQGPQTALAATKRLIGDSFGRSLEAELQAEAEAFAGCAATGDFTEAVAAFIAKRAPCFTG